MNGVINNSVTVNAQLVDNIPVKASLSSGVDYYKGEDGFSPLVHSEPVEGGNELIIEDKTGTTSFVVYNGKDGANGKDGKDGTDGKDGYAPIVKATSDDGINYFATCDESILENPQQGVLKNGQILSLSFNVPSGSKDGTTIRFNNSNTKYYLRLTDSSGADKVIIPPRADYFKANRNYAFIVEDRGGTNKYLVCLIQKPYIGYELIEDITLTENVDVFERTSAEAEGINKDYSFTAMIVVITTQKNNANASTCRFYRNSSSSSLTTKYLYSPAAKTVTRLKIDLTNGGDFITATSNTPLDSMANIVAGNLLIAKEINKLYITNLLEGTRIQIYGVWR